MAFVSHFGKAFQQTQRTSSPFTTAITNNLRRRQFARMTLRADLDHIALDCKENEKMHTFYRDVLQFEGMQLPGAPFPSVRVSDLTILDFMKSDKPRGVEGANHICFSVTKDAMEDLKVRLTDAGVEIGEPRLLGGAKGRGWAVYVKDIENNTLEFRYYD